MIVQKKLEAKELKREAQTAEDKWEMRKAILAKEALIESVCSTTKVMMMMMFIMMKCLFVPKDGHFPLPI